MLLASHQYGRLPLPLVPLEPFNMPRMNGLTIASLARDIRPDIPIVLLTGHGESAELERRTNLPIDALLLKPVTHRSLMETLANVLRSRLGGE